MQVGATPQFARASPASSDRSPTDRRGSELRDARRRLGIAMGAVLEGAQVLVKEWGNPGPENRWLRFEAWFIGACMAVSLVAWILRSVN